LSQQDITRKVHTFKEERTALARYFPLVKIRISQQQTFTLAGWLMMIYRVTEDERLRVLVLVFLKHATH
jgi:hypothetical protein